LSTKVVFGNLIKSKYEYYESVININNPLKFAS
jgi:hypothetical protein